MPCRKCLSPAAPCNVVFSCCSAPLPGSGTVIPFGTSPFSGLLRYSRFCGNATIIDLMWSYTVLILSTLSIIYLLTFCVRVCWKST